MKLFKEELLTILESTLSWSEDFVKGKKDYDFDIDTLLNELAFKYGINFSRGSFKLIYNLLDFYTDAIKHEFIDIQEGYSVKQARDDIKKIILLVRGTEQTSQIELPEDLSIRLKLI